MSEKGNIIKELLDGLDTIRPTLLASKEKNGELRSLLRRMLSLLESLQRMPHIEPALYARVITILTPLVDAEHGALIKHLQHEHSDTQTWQQLEQHLQTRQQLIKTAQQDLPSVQLMLRRSCNLLDKPYPDTGELKQNLSMFEQYLKEYLQHHAKIRLGFTSITAALKDSVKAMDHVLDDIGDESPELKQAQKVLEQELPEDPIQAQVLLKNAAQNIRQASQKLSSASHKVKATMSAQIQQMNGLSERLKQAEDQARNDPLTGLGNRRKLREYFNTLPQNETSLFLMLDIDFFKKVNDTYGHDAGDEVLIKIADLLKQSVRSTDMVARLGGEEFCIVLANTATKQGIQLAENIRQKIEAQTFESQHGKMQVTISIGIAERQINETINHWLKRADQALYHAKNNGRNQVTTAALPVAKSTSKHQGLNSGI
ncbi:MAG: GGDEF domain-containing protein [Ghiorsea sp.]|nr:GGDEF domain-containing protein [Ghiorsea sp.]